MEQAPEDRQILVGDLRVGDLVFPGNFLIVIEALPKGLIWVKFVKGYLDSVLGDHSKIDPSMNFTRGVIVRA